MAVCDCVFVAARAFGGLLCCVLLDVFVSGCGRTVCGSLLGAWMYSNLRIAHMCVLIFCNFRVDWCSVFTCVCMCVCVCVCVCVAAEVFVGLSCCSLLGVGV